MAEQRLDMTRQPWRLKENSSPRIKALSYSEIKSDREDSDLRSLDTQAHSKGGMGIDPDRNERQVFVLLLVSPGF